MKDLGAIQWVLKIKVTVNRELGFAHWDQAQFITTFLKKFNLMGLPERDTPYSAQHKLTCNITEEDVEFMKDKQKLIRPILGNCQWATHTHPLIKPTLNRLCQLQNCFGKLAWKALMWLCGYLKANLNQGIFFHRKKWQRLVMVFGDVGVGFNTDNAKSREGAVGLLMENVMINETA